MKVSKNNFDIVVYPVSSCRQCAFGISTQKCWWADTFKKFSFDCGGAITPSLSDIFKL